MTEVLVAHLHQVWSVPARIVTWIDGDTVDVIAEVLPYEWSVRRVRVATINAPEISQPGGMDAKLFAMNLLPRGAVVRLVSDRRENYGRVLASIWFGGAYFGQESRDFGQEMIDAGHAVLYGKNTGVDFQP